MKGRAAYTHSPKQKLEVAEKSSLSFGRISPLFVHSLNSKLTSLLKIQYGTILTKKSYCSSFSLLSLYYRSIHLFHYYRVRPDRGV